MLVGTSSGVGKSFLATGFCRYFKRQGVKVAPFKAQNISLNSFVTLEGGEMGRAQVVQAQAAKLRPHTDMNPILLKPTGNAGSQLIVNGQPEYNITPGNYYENTSHIRTEAYNAFDRLYSQYELIIIEGAGSPAEINLQDKDFINMPMAQHAGARTILVADIDPGGVFAAIYGTIKLIPSKYRRLICGVIINKFRGDVSMLTDGIRKIEELTEVPVLGVIPYTNDLKIEEEDALSLDKRSEQITDNNNCLDIAVIRLPRISNFTDFMVFENLPGVCLRYVSKTENLGNPDLIMIPGTKHTLADMDFLRCSGLADEIMRLYKNEVPVFGICGGFQILGKSIEDPDGVEGDTGAIEGLDMLPVKTVLTTRKELAQVKGKVVQDLPFMHKGTEYTGYEIHMGKTVPIDDTVINQPLTITSKNETPCKYKTGMVSHDGLVFGSYVHGIFDEITMRNQLLSWLCQRKGLDNQFIQQLKTYDPDSAYESLANLVENHLDLSMLCNQNQLQ